MAEDTFGIPSNIELKDVAISSAGKSMDITDLISEITIYEKLNNPRLHGRALIVDAANVLTQFSIQGQELIQFTIKKMTFEETVVMYVSGVETVTIDNNGTSTYVLTLVENTLFGNSITLVSQAYEGTITETISSIYKDYLGIEIPFVEESSGSYKCIIPNWHPFTAIEWLLKRAVTADGVPIVLTNTWRNGVRLLSYDTMFSRTSMEEFFPNNFPDQEASAQGNTFNYKQIMQKPTLFRVVNSGNTLKQIQTGSLAYTSLSVDSVGKSADLFEYSAEDDFKAKPRLNEFMPHNDKVTYGEEKKKITELAKTRQQTSYYQSYCHGDKFLSYNAEVNSTVPFRNNYQNMLESYKYDMQIHGRFDIEVGSIVDITFPANKLLNPTEPEDNIDNRRSGKHLVTAAMHVFKIDQYMMSIECSTDGFGEAHDIK